MRLPLTRKLRFFILNVIIVLITLSVLLFHFYNKYSTDTEDVVVKRKSPLVWHTLRDHRNSPPNVEDDDCSCRNSVQGRDILVDDRGFICSRKSSLANGCCSNSTTNESNYNCSSCNDISNCCGIYEYCVSCCLNPDNKPLLELVLSHTRGRQALVFSAVPDQFELCLVKCRTSSHSVQHENRYRDTNKFCFGLTTAHESEVEVIGGRPPFT